MNNSEFRKNIESIIIQILKIIKPEEKIDVAFEAFNRLYGLQIILDLLELSPIEIRQDYVQKFNTSEEPEKVILSLMQKVQKFSLQEIFVYSLKRIIEMYLDGDVTDTQLSEEQREALNQIYKSLDSLVPAPSN